MSSDHWSTRRERLADEARERGLIFHERSRRWVDPETGLVYSARTRPLVPITGRDGQGYVKVGRTNLRAHTVVWEVVNGPVPQGMSLNHINFDRADNRIKNLECVTQGDNVRHSARAGRMNVPRPNHQGEKHHAAVLTEDAVREIRAQRGTTSSRILAEQYGVSAVTISAIWTRRNWSHVA